MKPSSCMFEPEGNIELPPPDISNDVDAEGELGVIIGRECRFGIQARSGVGRNAAEPVVASVLRQHDPGAESARHGLSPWNERPGDHGVSMKREDDRTGRAIRLDDQREEVQTVAAAVPKPAHARLGDVGLRGRLEYDSLLMTPQQQKPDHVDGHDDREDDERNGHGLRGSAGTSVIRGRAI